MDKWSVVSMETKAGVRVRRDPTSHDSSHIPNPHVYHVSTPAPFNQLTRFCLLLNTFLIQVFGDVCLVLSLSLSSAFCKLPVHLDWRDSSPAPRPDF